MTTYTVYAYKLGTESETEFDCRDDALNYALDLADCGVGFVEVVESDMGDIVFEWPS